MIHLLLAEDNPDIRKIITRLVLEENDMIIVAQAENGRQALELSKTKYYNVLILDFSLPDINAFTIIKEIKQIDAGINILVINSLREEIFAQKSIMAGAEGYLNKFLLYKKLKEAIRHINSGKNYISPPLYKEKIQAEPEYALSYKKNYLYN